MKKNKIFNLLKAFGVITFLSITGPDENSYPFLFTLIFQIPGLFIYLIKLEFKFIDEYQLISLFIFLNLIVFLFSRMHKDKYSFILCFLSLLISITYINLFAEFQRLPDNISVLNPFSITISIFILFSIGIIILNFYPQNNNSSKLAR